MSKLYPAQFGRQEQYRNPDTTLPLPEAHEIPRAFWVQPRLPVRWGQGVAVGPGLPGQDLNRPFGTLYRFEWESPWYDLRPDLRSAEAQPKIGVPIWTRAARLYIEIMTAVPFGFQTVGLTATGEDYYETTSLDPGQVPAAAPGPTPVGTIKTASPPVDLTSTFFPPTIGATRSSLGIFSPPGTTAGGGDGYPVRFWKLGLAFEFFQEDNALVPVPTLGIQASYY